MKHSIYEKYGLSKVINACGKMTALGASCVSHSVGNYIKDGAQEFVVIEELMQVMGDRIAKLIGAEGVCITSSASAGIVIAIASIVTDGNRSIISDIPFIKGIPNQIIIQKGHCINYGVDLAQVIAVGGGNLVEIGSVNKTLSYQVRDAINDQTAGLFFVQSHHANQKGSVMLKEYIEIAKEYDIPLIVDAAAEEDLIKYYNEGADLTIYSGHKAIAGPTSGLIIGKQELITNCLLQYSGIGRCMKVGKENVLGLMKAVENYVRHDKSNEKLEQLEMLAHMDNELKSVKGVSTKIVQDEAGREIWRLQIDVDSEELEMTAHDIVKELECGSPRIFTRNHYVSMGQIGIDARPLKRGEEVVIVERLKEIIFR